MKKEIKKLVVNAYFDVMNMAKDFNKLSESQIKEICKTRLSGVVQVKLLQRLRQAFPDIVISLSQKVLTVKDAIDFVVKQYAEKDNFQKQFLFFVNRDIKQKSSLSTEIDELIDENLSGVDAFLEKVKILHKLGNKYHYHPSNAEFSNCVQIKDLANIYYKAGKF